MSVFGVDFGTQNSVVSVTRNGGIDIICNEVSKRETSTYVSLGDAERKIGESGLDRAVRNINHTVSCIKQWIGMRTSDPEFEHQKNFLFCDTTTDDNGRVKFELNYNDEPTQLYPEQIAAMFVGQLARYASREASIDAGRPVDVKECVLTVPCWYTAEHRQLLVQACEIAGLNCMSLINESTSAALDYGIFRGASLPETEGDAQRVAIVDIGYATTTVTVAEFWKGSVKIVAHACDRSVGLREADFLLFEHFATEVQKKYNVDVRSNKRARLRLLQGCEKVRTMLSGNLLAPLNIENLMDVDVNIQNFQRGEFETIIAPLLEKYRAVMKEALASAGVTDLTKLHAVELIGGGCRVPSFKVGAQEVFERAPSFTLNASESIARGAAITAAVFSPKFKVREFVVNETCVFPVCLGYFSDSAKAVSSVSFLPTVNKVLTILHKGDKYPKTLELTFDRSDAFDLFVFYDEEHCKAIKEQRGQSLLIGKWSVGSTSKKTNGKVKIAVKFAPSGIIAIESASTTEEYEVEEIVKPTTPAAPAAEGDAKATEEPAFEKKTVVKTRKVELTVTPTLGLLGHSAEMVLASRRLEETMHTKDKEIQRLKEVKNELESYVYDNRTRFQAGGIFVDFATAAQAKTFIDLANTYETWLYEDGSDSTVGEYQSRLDKLKEIGVPTLTRQRLSEEIPFAQKGFTQKMATLKGIALAKIGAAAHITEEELQGAAKKCDEASAWGDAQLAAYQASNKAETPTLSQKVFDAKYAEVEKEVKAVINKPVPPPPKKEEAKPKTPEAEGAPKEAPPAPAPAQAAPNAAGPPPQTDLD